MKLLTLLICLTLTSCTAATGRYNAATGKASFFYFNLHPAKDQFTLFGAYKDTMIEINRQTEGSEEFAKTALEGAADLATGGLLP